MREIVFTEIDGETFKLGNLMILQDERDSHRGELMDGRSVVRREDGRWVYVPLNPNKESRR